MGRVVIELGDCPLCGEPLEMVVTRSLTDLARNTMTVQIACLHECGDEGEPS